MSSCLTIHQDVELITWFALRKHLLIFREGHLRQGGPETHFSRLAAVGWRNGRFLIGFQLRKKVHLPKTPSPRPFHAPCPGI